MSRPAILVTGGATRIGAEIVRTFADEGWHVIIHYNRSSDAAEELADSLPRAETVQCDLSDLEAASRMIEDLSHRIENWRVLVNSASVFKPDDVTMLDPATNSEAMQVNAVTPALMAQIFLSHSRGLNGLRVIQVTDQKLENPNPDFFSYTMSKHALGSTIAMLAMGATGENDRVYGLAPGAILPSHDQSPDEIELSHRLNPLGRKTGADEIAQASLFLASGVLQSGSTLFVDSGQHILQQDRDVIYLARAMCEKGLAQ